MQEPKTGLWVVDKLKREILKKVEEARKEQIFFQRAKNLEAQGKVKALSDIYQHLMLLELSLEEEAEKLRRMVDVYGNPIQQPHLIDL